MMLTGRVFDRITLGALILALGLLVDDAIIAIEMMVVKLEEGFERIKAAAYAWSHTAAPMLAGTLVTVIGFMPVGFARSTAGEYAGNIFWIVGFALIASWIVAVVFTPYLGVKLLPNIEPMPRRPCRDLLNSRTTSACVGSSAGPFGTSSWSREWWSRVVRAGGLGMGLVKQQFFPSSDRPEVLVEVQMPEGTSIEATTAATAKVEDWLRQQPEAKIVTTYIGQGAPRFFLPTTPSCPIPPSRKSSS